MKLTKKGKNCFSSVLKFEINIPALHSDINQHFPYASLRIRTLVFDAFSMLLFWIGLTLRQFQDGLKCMTSFSTDNLQQHHWSFFSLEGWEFHVWHFPFLRIICLPLVLVCPQRFRNKMEGYWEWQLSRDWTNLKMSHALKTIWISYVKNTNFSIWN